MQRITQEFEKHLKLDEEDGKENEQEIESHGEDYEDYDDDEDEDDFSFAFDGVNFSTISAEDAFDNGQIRPVYPLFNRDILLGGGVGDGQDLETLRMMVFKATTSSSTADEEAVGPYCEWSKKVVEALTPKGCKKSSSTGFSKIWRFKDFVHRSNSNGRDAFVFLNHPTPSAAAPSAAAVSARKEEKAAEGVPLKKVNGNNGAVGVEAKKVKKVKKSKTAALSPHEVYMRSKAKEGDRRRSYLPYRPELVGLFTNVHGGGLTRNVHPF
ncbi:uncharacterized protein LOC113753741 [Coffea eugenioides]|uniref:uncharacterized protein LOC113753741 n=1 Tax=Coffea eugenioides TaxID=49369 RepID=UPI000F6091ED|nr:uncharacterized protein LOC113753741 [Coffea eugenioides]